MRRLARGTIWAALPFVALGAWAAGVGCENTAGDCELTAECTGSPGATVTCEPGKSSGPVADSCGVFVSASASAGGDGSRSKPFTTFAEAVSAVKAASARRIYACAETFAEEVEVPAALALYGGLDCKKDWAYSAAGRTTIAPASGVPLTFVAGGATYVENVHAKAPDGAPPAGQGDNGRSGGSSIAAIALSSSTVELVRCELEAGNGADGIAAEELAPLDAAQGGNKGANACLAGEGGAPLPSSCSDLAMGGGVVDTSGGKGGDGSDAELGPPAAAGSGPAGGVAGDPQTASDSCTDGGPGGSGADGDPGKGGQPAASLLDPGFRGSAGMDGTAGIPGSGGGGGGKCSAGKGPGGGGGGAGGCSGAAGRGGGAGGSSIALWAVDASVSLGSVALTAGKAGKGAPGTAGQKGAAGGAGGFAGDVNSNETAVACIGGAGGKGGDGGPGGGGQGGYSIAAVWKTVAPDAANSIFTAGTSGKGGPGGTGAESASAGADGLACEGLDVTKGKCVTP